MKAANSKVNIEDLDPKMKKFIEDLEVKLKREVIITSGYRGPNHPIEAAKSSPGEHSTGLAVDVACIQPASFYEVVMAAGDLGCKRIGISRKSKFVHLGLDDSRPNPTIWTY